MPRQGPSGAERVMAWHAEAEAAIAAMDPEERAAYDAEVRALDDEIAADRERSQTAAAPKKQKLAIVRARTRTRDPQAPGG